MYNIKDPLDFIKSLAFMQPENEGLLKEKTITGHRFGG